MAQTGAMGSAFARMRVAGASVCSGAAADGAPPAVEVRKMSNEGDLGRELSGSEVDRCVREVETSGGRSASRDSRGIAELATRRSISFYRVIRRS